MAQASPTPPLFQTERQCKTCRKWKDADTEFYGRWGECKECQVARSQAWILAHPEQTRTHRKRARFAAYGITEEDFHAILADQDGTCAICNTIDPGRGTKNGTAQWHIDHDHETGAVRGILCRRCNLAIGHFNDDPAMLDKAAAYLRNARIACDTNETHATNLL